MKLQAPRKRSTCELQRMPLTSTARVAAAEVRSISAESKNCYYRPPCVHAEDLLPQCTRFSILKHRSRSPALIAPLAATAAGTSLSRAAPLTGRPATGSTITRGRSRSFWDPMSAVSSNHLETNQLTLRPQQHHRGGGIVAVDSRNSCSCVSTSVASNALFRLPADDALKSGRVHGEPQAVNWGSFCCSSTGTLTWMCGRQLTDLEPGYAVSPAVFGANAAAAPAAAPRCVVAGVAIGTDCIVAVGPTPVHAEDLKSDPVEVCNITHLHAFACHRTRNASKLDTSPCAAARDGGNPFLLRPEEVQAFEQQHYAQQVRRYHRGASWWMAERQLISPAAAIDTAEVAAEALPSSPAQSHGDLP